MRIYENFAQAINEMSRDLKEMGIKIENNSRHDKYDNNPDYHTLELRNHAYTILKPSMDHLSPVQPWADSEWEERLAGILGKPQNPGKAMSLRSDDGQDNHDWRDYLEVQGHPVSNLKEELSFEDIFKLNDSGERRFRFSYTYPERLRLGDQILRVIEELKYHGLSRQLWVDIWKADEDAHMMGSRRVPCTLGYWFVQRNGKLHIHYVMRSCEFGTHYHNDCYLALKLLQFVCDRTGLEMGDFTHTIFSFHVYERNVKDVF